MSGGLRTNKLVYFNASSVVLNQKVAVLELVFDGYAYSGSYADDAALWL